MQSLIYTDNKEKIFLEIKSHLEAIIEIIRLENIFLGNQQINEVLQIIPKKIKLITAFEEFQKSLASMNFSKTDSEYYRMDLKKLFEDFDQVTKENGIMLKISINLNNRFIGILFNILKKNEELKSTYNSSGKPSKSKNSSNKAFVTYNNKI